MLRWLIVGMGNAGRVHAAAIERSSKASLAGVVSSRQTAGTVPRFSNLAAALRNCPCDGVIVATPNAYHADLCCEVLAAGLPVLCEKPVGQDLADAQRVLAASNGADVPAGLVLNQRACRHARFIRELIDEGTFAPAACRFSASLPRLTGWAARQGAGGGLLRTIAIHYVDLLCWWFGAPSSFHGELAGRPTDDRVTAAFRFPGDVVATLHFTATDAGTGPVRAVIEGDGQFIEMDRHEIKQVRGLPAPPPAEPPDPDQWFGPGHRTLIDEASRSLLAGGGFPIPLEAGLATLSLVSDLGGCARGAA